MSTATTPTAVLTGNWSLADLHDHLGGIPLNRIRGNPTPGQAVLQDVVDVHDREGRICELIDGVLVEKTMGFFESRLALIVGYFLNDFLRQHDLGIVAGADGPLQSLPDQVRIPDVSFISWDRFPGRLVPREPVPELAPDLAVEVLSDGNTKAEMRRKLREYFAAGTQLVWLIDPKSRTANIHTTPDVFTVVNENESLDGGDVLPGFTLPLDQLFARAGKRQQ